LKPNLAIGNSHNFPISIPGPAFNVDLLAHFKRIWFENGYIIGLHHSPQSNGQSNKKVDFAVGHKGLILVQAKAAAMLKPEA
jgi:hypothetical protein